MARAHRACYLLQVHRLGALLLALAVVVGYTTAGTRAAGAALDGARVCVEPLAAPDHAELGHARALRPADGRLAQVLPLALPGAAAQALTPPDARPGALAFRLHQRHRDDHRPAGPSARGPPLPTAG